MQIFSKQSFTPAYKNTILYRRKNIKNCDYSYVLSLPISMLILRKLIKELKKGF